ncbi:putative striatin pro11 protein [Phaeoacremonium minimum UCRPA7]|uniref:Putative striatin pro11 protein n=1 Tax=Phaeoacremonium minimum (strain UCR-PA7) TaxID=1286976 RepID=R8BBQ4_PHAM7|nr:putative striatin pro11 protein [Phaeoacremonium minimum UCRPA7]EON96731.1 putative striatin pro11 protein [Phaeoacremonium minimum UCRPA7]
MQSNQQPPATEYTLQGVMRFLQTEWHRHERDRNAWEIEKQEMKGRIAALEGAQRRADANQKALKKYVAILEKKVKDQRDQLKGSSASASVDAQHEADAEQAKKLDRNALIQEKLRSSVAAKIPGATTEMEGVELERISDDETQRSDLKTFLDQCQAEFTYLMITPANPLPPRDSPPLPLLDELQNHVQEIAPRPAPPQGYAVKTAEPPQQVMQPQTQPMLRSTEQTAYPAAVEWPGPVSVTSRAIDEVEAQKPFPRETNEVAPAVKSMDDAWDFNDSQEPIPVSSNRPDVDVFPTADNMPKSPNRGPGSHRRKSSMSRRRSAEQELSLNALAQKAESGNFKLRYGLRGHLDTVRTVIFSGGGSPGEPEICTAGDDGLIKRFHIPRNNPGHLHNNGANTATSDLDVQADFTHRGHTGAVMCLASWSPSPNLSTGGRAQGDGWIFSGGQDSTIRVWERGRVDPKATLDGHTDAVWSLCVLPATLGAIFGQTNPYGSPDRILLASGAADGTIRVWAVSAPPQMTSPQPPAAATGRRGAGSGGRVRGNSMSSGSAFPSSPQPTVASNSPFHYTLVHSISRTNSAASPTCITALSGTGESFVVSYSDAAIIVYDTRTGEEIGNMASLETYDGTLQSSVNSVVATTVGLDQSQHQVGEEDSGGGPTGGGRAMAGSGVEGVVISGHEDRFIRFFDANSGQCTYNMLAHPAAISSLSLSPDGRELVSAGHDASLRFWSLETRSCTQEITSHRIMRGEGVCAVVWGGRWVVSGGGDGIVKVFAR